MRRRSLLLGLAAAASGPGVLAACSAAPGVLGGAAGVAGTSAPVLASTAGSSLAPQPVTRYVPAAGQAPARAFAVGRRDLELRRGDRPLPVRVWYPASGPVPATPAPADGLPAAPGRFPLVLFSHGLTAQPEDYAAMLSRWVQAGLVVAGPRYPHTSYGAEKLDASDIVNQPADASFVLDSLLGLGAADPLGALLDPDRVAAAGHSAGGITTAGLFSAARDPRLKAGVVLAGTDFQGTPFGGPPAALLFVHGRDDETVAWRAGHTVFLATPWSRAMLTITEGGHTTTGDDFEATTGTTTEFWRWSLYGDAAARARIPAAAAAGGVATLENDL